MSAEEWVVYEQATGVPYKTDLGTQDRALEEAILAGPGHVAMPLELAHQLEAAFAHGRHAALQERPERPHYPETLYAPIQDQIKQECVICGVPVVNVFTHARWHVELDRLIYRPNGGKPKMEDTTVVPESRIVASAVYDPGTISAPAFLDITFQDGRMLSLKGRDAKQAHKRQPILRPGDEFAS